MTLRGGDCACEALKYQKLLSHDASNRQRGLGTVRQSLIALGKTVLPIGRTLGRRPFHYVLKPRKPAIGDLLQVEALLEVAEHLRGASEDMTIGRTLLGQPCREQRGLDRRCLT